jgi:hypothetical protein
MKYIKYTIIIICLGLFACEKVIDLYPQSNLNTGTYYSNLTELKAGLTGCYNGLQSPMTYEWELTELRSDNAKQGSPGSQSSPNRDLSDLDMYIPGTIHGDMYSYWLATYNNIRNANIILERLGVVYNPTAGTITLNKINIPISDADRQQLAGEALFIRGYHYFNLVRLFGGVFLIHTPVSAAEAKTINRSSVTDIYKLIEVDLKSSSSYLSPLKLSQIVTSDLGRATSWASKALLSKVYLTLNRKSEATILLQDVVANSGYSLLKNYADVFSITNEMNSEILFTVRYKAGGLGLGSRFGNDFGPLSSGSSVINGSGLGLNAPTFELDSAFNAKDLRKAVAISSFGTGTATRKYVKKYLTQVVLANDGESDWPILRYADVLLMLAEAQGNSSASIDLINQVRTRAGLTAYAPPLTTAQFELALSNERRFEFVFENQRFFDLVRFNTTLLTVKADQVLKNNFAKEYASHYALYPAPVLTLAQLQGNVSPERLLLPIPQHEIDTNPNLTIPQNPGY